MNNAIIIQQCYPGGGYEDMLAFGMEKHLPYARQHRFDYWAVYSDVIELPIDFGGWSKVHLIREALEQGYERVIWVDLDAFVFDPAADLRDGCPAVGIGATHHVLPEDHFNVGMLYVRNSELTRAFVDAWLAEQPGPAHWREQAVFNQLMKKYPGVVHEIDRKWNSTWNNNDAPDPVVLAYHGCGWPEQRLRMMKEGARWQP
jgi:hypothetical protein